MTNTDSHFTIAELLRMPRWEGSMECGTALPPRQIDLDAANKIEEMQSEIKHLLSVVEVLRKQVTSLIGGDDAQKRPKR